MLLAAILAVSFARPAWPGVFLSELCDPQNNYPTDRFIEIYNSGPGDVDLANWSVVAVANNLDVCTWPLSGTLAAGQAKVCGGPSTVTGFIVHFQSAVWATTAGYMNWNGRVGDGARLKDASSTVIDQVVATGTLFENADLVRIPSVTSPTAVFDPAQWTSTPVLLATDASPGSHNGSVPPVGGPAISNIVTDPAAPVAGVGVDVQATVVDTSEILGVTLSWGTTSGSQPNVIGMPPLSGDTYRTSSAIPPQSAGVTIYYRVQAENAAATSSSPVLSYTLGGGGSEAPTVLSVGQSGDSTLLVIFSEPVDEASAETPGNYTVGSSTAVAAVRDPVLTSRVEITILGILPGSRTLTVNGVADLALNVAFGVTRAFTYIDVAIPAGYYDGLAGLKGSALRVALHNRIRNHTVRSYDYALTAFATTDVKPTGKIWDMYSDVPGGTPPYEYSVGQTGQGATEGLGYNREHSWPQSWFGGASPMYSDLWILYPTDSKVNGYRANYPYGEVGTASITSWNGSTVGNCISPGYGGTVFEPIDPYKGDLARGQFYVATRYAGQDAGWPGSPSATGSQLVPWAAEQYLEWATNDPVSWKERLRNGAVYVIQNNRNPFVDHPEFVAMIYDSNAVAGVGELPATRTIQLRQNLPNPFASRTSIGFDLARPASVTLTVFDVTGRAVRVLAAGAAMEAGRHHAEWDGRDDAGTPLGAGLYFCRLEAGAEHAMRRMVFVR